MAFDERGGLLRVVLVYGEYYNDGTRGFERFVVEGLNVKGGKVERWRPGD